MAVAVVLAQVHGRAQSVEIGFSCQMDIQRLEAFGGLEQPGGGLGNRTGGRCDVSAQEIDPGTLWLVLRVELRDGEESQRLVERSGEDLSLGGRQRPAPAPLRSWVSSTERCRNAAAEVSPPRA
jgi:hypothetical protein